MDTGYYFNRDDTAGLTRANLPHWDQGEKYYFVTFRLADSLPAAVVDSIRAERDAWLEVNPKPWSNETAELYARLFTEKFEARLDAGHGSCCLRDLEIRKMVEEVLFHGDGKRYTLLAFVVMPNHLHILFRLHKGHNLNMILKEWKGVSSHRIQRFLKQEGQLWDKESWDRIVRSPRQHGHYVQYIADNAEHFPDVHAWIKKRNE